MVPCKQRSWHTWQSYTDRAGRLNDVVLGLDALEDMKIQKRTFLLAALSAVMLTG
jgi:N-acetyl-anhydromuramyl-L-alanine amidase AmpD